MQPQKAGFRAWRDVDQPRVIPSVPAGMRPAPYVRPHTCTPWIIHVSYHRCRTRCTRCSWQHHVAHTQAGMVLHPSRATVPGRRCPMQQQHKQQLLLASHVRRGGWPAAGLPLTRPRLCQTECLAMQSIRGVGVHNADACKREIGAAKQAGLHQHGVRDSLDHVFAEQAGHREGAVLAVAVRCGLRQLRLGVQRQEGALDGLRIVVIQRPHMRI